MCKSPYSFGIPKDSSGFLLPGCRARHLGRAHKACAKLSPKILPYRVAHALKQGKRWSFNPEYTWNHVNMHGKSWITIYNSHQPHDCSQETRGYKQGCPDVSRKWRPSSFNLLKTLIWKQPQHYQGANVTCFAWQSYFEDAYHSSCTEHAIPAMVYPHVGTDGPPLVAIGSSTHGHPRTQSLVSFATFSHAMPN